MWNLLYTTETDQLYKWFLETWSLEVSRALKSAELIKFIDFDNWKILDLLVVGPPLWKIWKSIGMISNPIYGKIKNVPNHQPVEISWTHQSKWIYWPMSLALWATHTARPEPSGGVLLTRNAPGASWCAVMCCGDTWPKNGKAIKKKYYYHPKKKYYSPNHPNHLQKDEHPTRWAWQSYGNHMACDKKWSSRWDPVDDLWGRSRGVRSSHLVCGHQGEICVIEKIVNKEPVRKSKV